MFLFVVLIFFFVTAQKELGRLYISWPIVQHFVAPNKKVKRKGRCELDENEMCPNEVMRSEQFIHLRLLKRGNKA